MVSKTARNDGPPSTDSKPRDMLVLRQSQLIPA